MLFLINLMKFERERERAIKIIQLNKEVIERRGKLIVNISIRKIRLVKMDKVTKFKNVAINHIINSFTGSTLQGLLFTILYLYIFAGWESN